MAYYGNGIAAVPCASVRPLGHVGEVEEIAKLYLMQQTYGTGQVLGVDRGGALARTEAAAAPRNVGQARGTARAFPRERADFAEPMSRRNGPELPG
jgi:hypothetical protein